jgi:hypothetical protein
MSEVKNLTPEELEAVKQIKGDYTNLALSLGELELQKADLEREKTNLLNKQSQIIERENQLAKELTEKYGNGSINLETGEITV